MNKEISSSFQTEERTCEGVAVETTVVEVLDGVWVVCWGGADIVYEYMIFDFLWADVETDGFSLWDGEMWECAVTRSFREQKR